MRLAQSGAVGLSFCPFGGENPADPTSLLGQVVHLHIGAAGANSMTANITTHDAVSGRAILRSSGITPDLARNAFPASTAVPNSNNAAQRWCGYELLIQCRRQRGDNPQGGWWVRTFFRNVQTGNSNYPGGWIPHHQLRAVNCAGAANPSPSWDGQNLSTAFLGMYAATAASGASSIRDLALLAPDV